MVIPADRELLALIAKEAWHQTAALRRRESELAQLNEESAAFARQLRPLLEKASFLRLRPFPATAKARVVDGVKTLAATMQEARALCDRIQTEWGCFHRETYRPLMGAEAPDDRSAPSAINSLEEALRNRCHQTLEPAVVQAVDVLNNVIAHCQKTIKEATHEQETERRPKTE